MIDNPITRHRARLQELRERQKERARLAQEAMEAEEVKEAIIAQNEKIEADYRAAVGETSDILAEPKKKTRKKENN